ncbi:hypothetical protein [Microbacterium sp. Clip185]|uniref:hypothetical protein n=1 Tax=Microbacterium sp. Clip185 TaxID=3025663 RepID=UPI0023656500|nr:hypothetical protein [Microbacterium sp. Clip185]WDG17780.1 hypothetical protein PQV94_14305 [Microbacterium sp. Clip185]
MQNNSTKPMPVADAAPKGVFASSDAATYPPNVADSGRTRPRRRQPWSRMRHAAAIPAMNSARRTGGKLYGEIVGTAIAITDAIQVAASVRHPLYAAFRSAVFDLPRR